MCEPPQRASPWGDGTTETVDPAVGTTSAAISVLHTTSGLLAPIRAHGSATLRSRAFVPVEVRFTDCDGSAPTDLAPRISVTALSGADAGSTIDAPCPPARRDRRA